jgi:4-hydroxy-2-oxoheptanedioate aldolase
MNGKQLRAALHQGRRVYGTLITTPSPHWPKAVQSTGLDFVFIDTEHIPIERTTLAWMCRTYAALGLAPIVRIPSPDPYEACVALDNGAEGVLAPYVETVEQVRQLVGAVRYRPLKGASLARITHEGVPPAEPLNSYIEKRCAGNILLINIESKPALDVLHKLLAVPGVDGVQVGPHDLTTSLGVPEQYDHPLFLAAVEDIIGTARNRGLGVGVHYWLGVERQIEWMRLGANLIVHSGDISLFTDSMNRDLKRFRTAFGEQRPDGPLPDAI